jgi:hypothetical protein
MRRLLGAAALLAALAACGYPDPTPVSGPVAGTSVTSESTPTPGGDDFNAGSGITPVKLPDGLQYVDVKKGDGATAGTHDTVTVQYTGWLSNGTKFDSSRDRGQPFQTALGQQQVIPGWDEGIPGMKVGGIRKLIVPPSLGYGAQGQPPTIPANSTLVFLVELLQVTPSPSGTPSPG